MDYFAKIIDGYQRFSVKKGVLRNFTNITGKQFCEISNNNLRLLYEDDDTKDEKLPLRIPD